MDVRKGIAVSPGVALQQAFVLKAAEHDISSRAVTTQVVANEVLRARQAVEKVRQEFVDIDRKAARRFGRHVIRRMFRAQIQWLDDPSFIDGIEQLIRDDMLSAEHAVSRWLRRHVESLDDLEDSYLSSRWEDFHAAESRLLGHLLGENPEDQIDSLSGSVVIAHHMSPRLAAMLDTRKVLGFATDVGDRVSHAAIIARSLQIPAVVALETVSSEVRTGDMVIVDGNRGLVITNPDDRTIHEYETYADACEGLLQRQHESRRARLRIFLCYSLEDRSSVMELYRRLRAGGFDPWMDVHDICPGQEWRQEITRGLQRADVVVVCLSGNTTNKKGYVQREIAQAIDIALEQPEGRTFIIPVRLDPCSVPERLSHLQFVDLYQEDGYQRLLNSLEGRAD